MIPHMDLDKDRVIGIVGGMGPEAGISLYQYILEHTMAVTDQQHSSVILMSFSKYIADRTLYLEGKTDKNPAFEIAEIIQKLAISGAKVVGLACNSSHAPRIFEVIVSEVDKMAQDVKLLHMPGEVVKDIQSQFKCGARIGLMATNGMYYSGVYDELLQKAGYDPVLPDVDFQNDVIHRMIYDPLIGIKANAAKPEEEALKLFNQAMSFFNQQEAEEVILGCTELSSIASGRKDPNLMLLDSSECLAKALIRETTYSLDGSALMSNTREALQPLAKES